MTFGKIELGLEGAGVFDLVDVEIDRAVYRPQIARIVTHVVPRRSIVERADLVDLASAYDEVPIVELVLVGRIELHRGAWLHPRASFLLRRDDPRCGKCQ